MSDYCHPIQVVAQRTGLSAFVIRIWEKRYGAVAPERTPTNRRLYSDAQIQRLVLLHELTRKGQSIGYVAKLTTEQLVQLAQVPAAETGVSTGPLTPAGQEQAFVEEGLAAVRALEVRALEAVLARAEMALGAMGMLKRVVAPLAKAIGESWREGSLTAAHEHFASAVLRTYLSQVARQYAVAPGGPVLVVTTPAGQLHELGALLVAAMAAKLGWQVTYLGASLPAPEIAGAARQSRAKAVALSLVYPADDPGLEQELVRLHALLPEEIRLLVGGRAMEAHRGLLGRLGALLVDDLEELGAVLDALRVPAPALRGDAAAADAAPRV